MDDSSCFSWRKSQIGAQMGWWECESEAAHLLPGASLLSPSKTSDCSVGCTVIQLEISTDFSSSCVFIYLFFQTVFPAVFSSKFIQHEIVGEYSHLFTVQGSDSELMPYMLLAHMDVVPAPPEGWDFPPFSAAEHEGFIYGRGTLDNKNSAIVRLLGNISERGKGKLKECALLRLTTLSLLPFFPKKIPEPCSFSPAFPRDEARWSSITEGNNEVSFKM